MSVGTLGLRESDLRKVRRRPSDELKLLLKSPPAGESSIM